MKLYDSWTQLIKTAEQTNNQSAFWKEYFETEKEIYKAILEGKSSTLEGTPKDLADKFNVEPILLCGFFDGINDSLKEKIELEELEENTPISVEIDFEKLLYNMHVAKAKWLYELKAWDGIFDKNKKLEIRRKFQDDHTIRKTNKIGRNDPCPCGSGKKYKKCCLNKQGAN